MVLSYDGTMFHGWQKQQPPDQPSWPRTVEGVLEECLRPALSQRVKFWPSGRTDAGVSATGQVVQFDAVLPEALLPNLADTINAALPSDVRCMSIAQAARDFSANECLWKRYTYTVPGDAAAVQQACLSMVGALGGAEGDADAAPPLNLEAMREASARLVGTHDFAAFQSKGGRATTVRTLYRFDVEVVAEGLRPPPHAGGDSSSSRRQRGGLVLTLEADGFLYNMVRILVGTVVQIGMGRRCSADCAAGSLDATERADIGGYIEGVLAGGERAKAGPKAPAAGLCLEHVEYESPNAPTQR